MATDLDRLTDRELDDLARHTVNLDTLRAARRVLDRRAQRRAAQRRAERAKANAREAGG